MKKFLTLGIVCLILCGCGDSKDNLDDEIKVGSVSCNEMKTLVNEEDAVLIDVRTEEEYTASHLYYAIHLNYETIDKTITNQVSDKNRSIVVYCQSGKRSAVAKEKLESLGYTKVYDLGSINSCK